MITPQDIREKTFEKAVFGGYDMASVDQFLEEVAGDLTLLRQEKDTLLAKMKVLVDKISEYRNKEEALQLAVVSAQKLGVEIEQEARKKADDMLTSARKEAEAERSKALTEAERITAESSARIKAEELRLEEAKKTSAAFIESMDKLCRKQLEFLERVGEMNFMKESRAAARPAAPEQSAPPAPQPTAPQPAASQPQTAQTIPQPVRAAAPQPDPPQIHETVKSIEETLAKVIDEPVINVRPAPQHPIVEDERPTKSFNIVTDPEDDVDKTNQFSLEDFAK